MKRVAALAAVFLAVAAGGGWAADELPAELVKAPPEPAGFGGDYLIGPGDQLGIEVWKDAALTRTVVVLPDGKISFPLIGELAVEGETVAWLKGEIETRIGRFVPNPVVTVEVRQSNSMHIYVLGRVNNPGRAILTCNVNVLQALAIAGGPTPFANRSRITVFRQERGTTKTYPFDYGQVTAGNQLETNIVLKRGDVIFVP